MKPHRIQLSRRKGWRMPPNTAKVDRSTKWGNPFSQTSNAENAALFKTWLTGPSMSAEFWRRRLSDLRGKNLACWCKHGEPCHADVLLELANA